MFTSFCRLSVISGGEIIRRVLDLSYRQCEKGTWRLNWQKTLDIQPAWSHFHTPITVTCASCGRSFRKEGWTETTDQRWWLFHKRKGQNCDKNPRTHGLTWDRSASFSSYTLNYFPSRQTMMILPQMFKKKRKRKRNKHKPRRRPRCSHRRVSCRARRPPACHCLTVCLYRASLPMMTPMTKKRTQRARMRVLRPSSLMAEVAMAEEEEEWGEPTEVPFLFRSPSSSCGEEKGWTVKPAPHPRMHPRTTTLLPRCDEDTSL